MSKGGGGSGRGGRSGGGDFASLSESKQGKVISDLQKTSAGDFLVTKTESSDPNYKGLRGQGKRVKNMVKGAMSSVTPVTRTKTELNFDKLKMSEKQKEEYQEYKPPYASSQTIYTDLYARARKKGYNHSESIDIAVKGSNR